MTTHTTPPPPADQDAATTRDTAPAPSTGPSTSPHGTDQGAQGTPPLYTPTGRHALDERPQRWLSWPRTLALLLASYMLLALAPVLPDWLRALLPLALAVGAVVWALQMSAALRAPRATHTPASTSRMDRAAAWTNRHARPLMWWLLAYAMATAIAERAHCGALADFLRVTGLVQAGALAVIIAHQHREK